MVGRAVFRAGLRDSPRGPSPTRPDCSSIIWGRSWGAEPAVSCSVHGARFKLSAGGYEAPRSRSVMGAEPRFKKVRALVKALVSPVSVSLCVNLGGSFRPQRRTDLDAQKGLGGSCGVDGCRRGWGFHRDSQGLRTEKVKRKGR